MSFRGAPITLCLCSTLVLGTFLAGSLPKVRQALALESAASVLAPHRAELWRLLTSSLFLCDNLVAAGVSAYLLFHLRFFERQLGSSKFGAYVTLSTLADAGARAAFLALPGGVGALGVASGPLHLIFGLLPLYIRAWGIPPARDTHCRGRAPHSLSLYAHARPTAARASRLRAGTVPVLYPDALTIVGLRLSEKSFFYALCALLAASEGLSTAWPSACGLALGALYALPRSPLASLRYPRAVRQFARAYILPLLQGAAAAPAPAPAPGQAAGAGAALPRAQAPAAPVAPSPEAVQQLVAMGFSAQDAEAALQASRGNVDAAVEALLAR